MKIKFTPKPVSVGVKSLQDAYNKGWFSGSISRDRLLAAVRKRNEHRGIRIRYAKDHAAICDDSGFVCGVSRLCHIPQFTLSDETSGYIFCRSWRKILETLRRKGYEVYESDLY